MKQKENCKREKYEEEDEEGETCGAEDQGERGDGLSKSRFVA